MVLFNNDNDEDLLFSDDNIFTNNNVNNNDVFNNCLEKWKVMIVDDEQEVHNITKLVLNDFVFDGKPLEFISAYSGAEAKQLVAENPDTSVILLDVVMEEDDSGLEVAKFIREDLKNKLVRIVLRTGQPGQAPEKKIILDYDINDYKEKTELTGQKLFTLMVSSIRSYNDIKKIDLLNMEIENTQKEIIFTLGEVSEVRSKETGNHVRRVAEYSKLLASKYGLSQDDRKMIGVASPMHDVGKLGIPDSILNKPGKLTPEEFEIIKSHSIIGYDILKNSQRSIMQSAAIIALEHHEKFNGMGYPNGLKGDNIHIFGRITAIADVFDALANDRVYKKAWEISEILKLFREESGEHFDPVLVNIFLDHIDDVLHIKNTFSD